MYYILDLGRKIFFNIYFFLLLLFIVAGIVIFFILRTILSQETNVDIFQGTSLFLVALGIVFTAVQAISSYNDYKYTITPLLLHVGFFDFFDSDTRPQNLVVAEFKNVGERVAYNIRGWVINNSKFYQLIFGEVINNENDTTFRGDFKYTWSEKTNKFMLTINKPSTKELAEGIDHIILIYEDNQSKTFFTLLTRDYKYTTGFFNLRRISKVTRISMKKLEELLISVQTS
jgi:hypothetical protein